MIESNNCVNITACDNVLISDFRVTVRIMIARNIKKCLYTSERFKLIKRQLHHNKRIYCWNDVLFMTNTADLLNVKWKPNFNDKDKWSHFFFSDKNLIKKCSNGLFVIMPYVYRAMNKLIDAIDCQMSSINAQKIVMPALVHSKYWMQSGRWTESGGELFRLKDRHNEDFCLAPTHEEIITDLISSHSRLRKLSFNQLPIYLYQITPKFRDELRAKHGLLRGREFLMKDLYTFDSNEDTAKITYETVCSAYEKLFTSLELPVIKAQGSVGTIGGKYSHEFHLISDVGEDKIYICESCNAAFNSEIFGEIDSTSDDEHNKSRNDNNDKSLVCLSCESNKLIRKNAIEVGHAFLLGDRYSKAFNTTYLSADANKPELCEMGCYGLGVTRILAAAVDTMSSDKNMKWPSMIVPFKICLLIPKKGSKEELGLGTAFSYDFADCLINLLNEDILIDDRTRFTIGNRLKSLKVLGIPYIIIAGKRIIEDVPMFEVIDNYSEQTYFFTQLETIQYFQKVI